MSHLYLTTPDLIDQVARYFIDIGRKFLPFDPIFDAFLKLTVGPILRQLTPPMFASVMNQFRTQVLIRDATYVTTLSLRELAPYTCTVNKTVVINGSDARALRNSLLEVVTHFTEEIPLSAPVRNSIISEMIVPQPVITLNRMITLRSQETTRNELYSKAKEERLVI